MLRSESSGKEMITKSPFSDLPQYAQDYTHEQRQRVVAYLSQKSLAELRRRQNIMHAQMVVARRLSDQYTRNRALTNLQTMFDMESEAIRLQM